MIGGSWPHKKRLAFATAFALSVYLTVLSLQYGSAESIVDLRLPNFGGKDTFATEPARPVNPGEPAVPETGTGSQSLI